MRILTVSDYPVQALFDAIESGEIDRIDLILACGDLPPEYLARLSHRLGIPVYYVMGNHDIRQDAYPPEGCVDLHGRLIRFGQIRVLGLEGSHWYNGGPNQYTEAEMKAIIRKLRPVLRKSGGVDIVIAHASPLGIHDAKDPCHRGFESFRILIDKYRPAYFIHGHIHKRFEDPAQRITELAQTKVINTYGYFLLEIESEEVSRPVRRWWKVLRRS